MNVDRFTIKLSECILYDTFEVDAVAGHVGATLTFPFCRYTCLYQYQDINKILHNSWLVLTGLLKTHFKIGFTKIFRNKYN